jgi:hypothetical protein
MKKEVSITTRRHHSVRSGRESTVPFIRLSGKWLDQIGFNEGARVRVSGEVGQLTLTIAYRKGGNAGRAG